MAHRSVKLLVVTTIPTRIQDSPIADNMNKTLTDYASSVSDPAISDLHVEKIPRELGRDFIKEHHYSGGCGTAAMVWGLYDDRVSELIGAIAFQTPVSEAVRSSIFGEEYKHKVTELHRMAIKDKAPHNTGSWFISRTLDQLKDYKPKYWAIVAFADTTEGHDGTVYQAANADYYGTTDKATFYRKPDGQLKHPRICGDNITIQDAKERGWDIEKRESKHRYVFWLPDEYQSKDELRELAAVDLQSYP